jgi:hypothetical protein
MHHYFRQSILCTSRKLPKLFSDWIADLEVVILVNQEMISLAVKLSFAFATDSIASLNLGFV